MIPDNLVKKFENFENNHQPKLGFIYAIISATFLAL